MKKTFAWILTILSVLPLLASANSSTGFYRPLVLVLSFPVINTDPFLINPRGFALTTEGNIIMANNGTSTSSYYSALGARLNFNPGTEAPVRPTLNINVLSNPTGVVINPSRNSFKFALNGKKKPAEFLYSTEQGTILAYSQDVDPINAIVVIDNSSKGAVYKGLETAKVNDEYYLYATDFHNGKIDVFNSEFKFVKSFTDSTIPTGFAPFNVRKLDGKLFVTYAKQLPPSNVNDDPGPGNGYVDIFTLKGKFIRRLISNGKLNSPWGLAIAPKNYGIFSHSLLVGNFGDGFINGYDLETGSFIAQLFDDTITPIQTPGLWGLRFSEGNPDRPQLYLSADLGGGAGLFALIQFSGND